MSKVFVPNNISHDLSPAMSYGTLVFVNRRYIYADELGVNNRIPVNVRNLMLDAVDRFDPKEDYLLLSGDHLQMAHLCALLGQRYGSFRVLRWDKMAGGYYEVLIG